MASLGIFLVLFGCAYPVNLSGGDDTASWEQVSGHDSGTTADWSSVGGAAAAGAALPGGYTHGGPGLKPQGEERARSSVDAPSSFPSRDSSPSSRQSGEALDAKGFVVLEHETGASPPLDAVLTRSEASKAHVVTLTRLRREPVYERLPDSTLPIIVKEATAAGMSLSDLRSYCQGIGGCET